MMVMKEFVFLAMVAMKIEKDTFSVTIVIALRGKMVRQKYDFYSYDLPLTKMS